jgi:hypothetical protein
MGAFMSEFLWQVKWHVLVSRNKFTAIDERAFGIRRDDCVSENVRG